MVVLQKSSFRCLHAQLKFIFLFSLQMLITLDHAYMSNEIHSFIESEIVVVQFTTQFLLCSSFVCQFNLGSWIIKVPSYTLIYIDTYLAIRCISVSNKSKFGLFIARIRNCNSKLHLGCRQSLYHQNMW